MRKLTVYIPTRGRTGHSQQITVREMQQYAKNYHPIIACPPEEVSAHLRYCPEVQAVPVNGIGPTRQWLLENAPTSHVVMLDDDMYFSRRRDPSVAVPLDRCTNLDPMFEWIEEQLSAGFYHGGISARQGNNHIPRPWVDCIRVNNAHFFNRDIFLSTGLRFDALPVMEDFYVTLSMLLKGYPNRVAYHYCWSQRGSGTKGGCSLYRTNELQAQAATKLGELFPDYVRVVKKVSTSGGKLFSGERLDVNISWLKAWADHIGIVTAEPDLRRR